MRNTGIKASDGIMFDLKKILIKRNNGKKDKLKEDKFKDVRTKSIANVENPGPHYYFNIGSVQTFEDKLKEAQKDLPKEERVQLDYQTKSNTWGDIMGWVFPIIIMIVLW